MKRKISILILMILLAVITAWSVNQIIVHIGVDRVGDRILDASFIFRRQTHGFGHISPSFRPYTNTERRDFGRVDVYLFDITDEKLAQMVESGELPDDVTHLYFSSSGELSDISPLAGLAYLRSLELVSTQVSDISPLADLQNLYRLWLWDNEISDLTPIANLTNLTRLSLEGNQISDITPLMGLENLERLLLSYNQISDLSPLAHLEDTGGASLVLDLSHNQISDLTPLNELPDLTMDMHLFLNDNQISALPPLDGDFNLRTLDLQLHNNQISDLTPLAGLVNIETLSLRLSNNQISDITPLAVLTNIRSLDLSNNQISDITALASLDLNNNQRTFTYIIPTIRLSNNQIEDITPLASLASDPNNFFFLFLRLYLDNNQIRDISPLADFADIDIGTLRLNNNQIRNIRPLANLRYVRELNLEGNPIGNWLPVRHIDNVWGRPSTENNIIRVLVILFALYIVLGIFVIICCIVYSRKNRVRSVTGFEVTL